MPEVLIFLTITTKIFKKTSDCLKTTLVVEPYCCSAHMRCVSSVPSLEFSCLRRQTHTEPHVLSARVVTEGENSDKGQGIAFSTSSWGRAKICPWSSKVSKVCNSKIKESERVRGKHGGSSVWSKR